jgi:hypothetical protein
MGLAVERTSRQPNSGALLAELKRAHEDLLRAIEELAELTAGPAPPKGDLVNIRWKVSSASLSRRLLWGRILMSLTGCVGPTEQQKLRKLQDMDIELLRKSTKHVGAWTSEAILEDWPGYCRDSRDMRAKMIEAITLEQETLFPILHELNRRTG